MTGARWLLLFWRYVGASYDIYDLQYLILPNQVIRDLCSRYIQIAFIISRKDCSVAPYTSILAFLHSSAEPPRLLIDPYTFLFSLFFSLFSIFVPSSRPVK